MQVQKRFDLGCTHGGYILQSFSFLTVCQLAPSWCSAAHARMRMESLNHATTLAILRPVRKQEIVDSNLVFYMNFVLMKVS